MTTSASAAEAHFRASAPHYMRLFMQDFDASELDAAAVFGNAGYESLGFTKLQEIKPVAPGSRGGFGWFMWTGPRRKAFEAYCNRNGLDPSDDEANYKFLFVELIGTEKGAIAKLKAAKTLAEKVVAFEEAFERAGVKAYPKRQAWAQIALDALRAAPVEAPLPVTPAEPSLPLPAPPAATPASPGWIPLLVIGVVAILVAAWVWISGHPIDAGLDVIQQVPHVVVPDGAPVPLDRPMPLLGKVEQPSIWTDIGLSILLSFIGPLVSAAATYAVGVVVYWWGRVLKSEFDQKSAGQLHAALERGILAAIDALGSRASKASLLAGAAAYAQQWNGGTVKRFGLTHDDLKQLAAPHLVELRGQDR